MEIETARKAIHQCEYEIGAILKTFETQTLLSVTSVRLIHSQNIGVPYERVEIVEMRVEV